MNSELESIFFLPIWIGTWIEKRIGKGVKGVKGVISYVTIYFIVTSFLFIITNGIEVWFINQMFSFFNTYLLLGMLYVFFIYWKRSEQKS
jgi:predicted Na+-dependent transporter